ncbi:NAD(P)-dependent oxidoreductase [Glycomyces albidus]|jgi:3-hydroxyisobutyrate dehydrogenase-like beta-hydroxyacid dehydrogenase|uniref:NAD(P)-dependent oxidoreductase n=1 Tax=Glycomyces albidus TaxID=2656774 RepID=A0A6L5G782_9ACTN|nr:NAD(P)-binding domain-containing protein [Glycomyces albidus]MQM25510.1 NAD(P)-dependent oxidoreductase [Glycomyces albidus]
MSAKKSVSVLGLGPMGRATVKVLLEAGYDVTVWNRSRPKLDAIAALGAKPADTVAEAVAANDVVLLSLIHYDAMYGVLEQGPADLTGKTIVNLSSDSPENTRKGAEWVTGRGGEFLTGAFMTQSDDLHHAASRLYVSGPRPLYEAHRGLLETIVPGLEYFGDDYGLAQLYYQAALAQFHAFLTSLEQAVAIVDAAGGDVDRFISLAIGTAQGNGDFIAYFGPLTKQGGWGDIANLKMMHAGAQHVIDAAEEVGVNADLTRTIQSFYQRALDASEQAGTPVPVYRILRGQNA